MPRKLHPSAADSIIATMLRGTERLASMFRITKRPNWEREWLQNLIDDKRAEIRKNQVELCELEYHFPRGK